MGKPAIGAVGKPAMRTAWAIMALLAVAIAGYAGRGMVSPSARPSFMADLFARAPLLMVFHVGGGSAALIIGAVQVNPLALSPSSFGGMVTHLGFGGLGVCWLGTTILAVRSILRLDIPAHRRWMYRSYALTLAAVTLRIYLPLSLALGIGFEDAYRVVAWLCWVPNLAIVEAWLLRGASSRALSPVSAVAHPVTIASAWCGLDRRSRGRHL